VIFQAVIPGAFFARTRNPEFYATAGFRVCMLRTHPGMMDKDKRGENNNGE
jgi:hypothetical protein